MIREIFDLASMLVPRSGTVFSEVWKKMEGVYRAVDVIERYAGSRNLEDRHSVPLTVTWISQ